VFVAFPGGTVGDIVPNVENSPAYQENEHVIAFLKLVSNRPNFLTVGFSQGKFLVSDDMVIRENQTYEQFLERIQNAINNLIY